MIKLDTLKLDPATLGSQGSAVLGIRDSGKTYTATLLAERLFENGIPFTAFDPIGVWRFLRVPGSGNGIPVVVAGGQEGDLPLTPASAPKIVEAAMQNGISLVIDLFDINLSKSDWRKIVRECVRLMLHRNKPYGLRHVFIEEAAEFAPQRVIDGDVYAEIEKLARMGGNSRLGYTLINQRAEEVNKAVLELCDNLFLHRQKGKNSLLSLGKWLDAGNVKDHKAIIETLATLPQGQCWAWMAGNDHATRIKVPAKNSLHPDRRVMRGDDDTVARTAVDVGEFVQALNATLPAIEADAKANDPKELKKRIADLEKQLRDSDGNIDSVILEAERFKGHGEGYEKGYRDGREGIDQSVAALLSSVAANVGNIATALAQLPDTIRASKIDLPDNRKGRFVGADGTETVIAPRPNAPVAQRIERSPPEAKAAGSSPAGRANSGEGVKPAQQKILDALAGLEVLGIEQPSRTQLALWADVSPTSGGYFNNLGSLRTAGLIDYPQGGAVSLTDEGRAIAVPPPSMTQAEMQDAVYRKVGNAKANILRALIAEYPEAIWRDALADKIGVSRTSGGYFNNLGALRTLGLIDYPAPGAVVACSVLFLGDGK